MKRITLIAFAAAFAANTAATAGEIDWNYLEAEYIGGKLESDANVDGVGISLFANPTGQVLLSGDFQYLSIEDIDFGGDIDVYSISLGTGYYFPLTDNFHLVAELNGHYSWDEFDDDEFGFAVGPGVRWQATDRIELAVSTYYTYGEETDSGFDASAGTVIDITENLSFIGGYIYGDGADLYYAGLQIPFGR